MKKIILISLASLAILLSPVFFSGRISTFENTDTSKERYRSIDGDYTTSVPTGNVRLSISGSSWTAVIGGLAGTTYHRGIISGGYMYTDPSSPFEQRRIVGSIKGNTVYYLNQKMVKL